MASFTVTVQRLPGVDPAQGPFRFELEWSATGGLVRIPIVERGPESMAVSRVQEEWLYARYPALDSPAAGAWLTEDRALFDRLCRELSALAQGRPGQHLQLLAELRGRRGVDPPRASNGLAAWNSQSDCTEAERARARAQDLSDYDALVSLAPAEAESWLLRADRRRLEHLDSGGALGDYERACALAPQDGHAWWGLGWCLYDVGRPAEAVPAFQRAVLSSKQAEEVRARRLALAAALERAGQLEAALEELGRVLRKSGRPGPKRPADATVHGARARCLAALGRSEEALGAWADASTCAPAEASFHCERARLLQSQAGRGAEALEAAAQGARLARGDAWEPLRLYGGLLRGEGRFAEALPVLEEALRRRPGDGRTAGELGMVLGQLGEGERALGLLDLCLAEGAWWPAHLARAHLRWSIRGDRVGAHGDLLRVLEAEPQHAAALALRAEMAASAR